MYPHRIRLRGPWEYQPIFPMVIAPNGAIEDRPGPIPAAGRLRIPVELSNTPLAGFRGRVSWRRRFHAPRKLDPSERMWLTFEGVDYFADISLNGLHLGRHESYFEPFEFEITSCLEPYNDLVAVVDCPAESDVTRPRMLRGSLETETPEFVAGLWGEVAIEVRSLAWLRDVVVASWMDGSRGYVKIHGNIVGQGSVALDLALDGACVAHARYSASPDGTEFELDHTVESPALWWPAGLGDPATYRVRLELHAAARTLDFVDRTVGFRQLQCDLTSAGAEVNGRKLPVSEHIVDSAVDPLFLDERFSDRFHARCPAERLVIHRVPGRVLATHVYDWADKHGVLLLQDFPISAGQSWDEERQSEAERQARSMVRLLQHHPSIGLWACPGVNDECGIGVRRAITAADPSRVCVSPLPPRS